MSRRVGQVFIENALSGQDLSVQGEGEDRLDFTDIRDFVHGVLQVIAHPGSRNEIFNLTHGNARSIAEMIDILKKDFPDVQVNYKPRDKLMPKRGTLSVDKARAKIDYNPSWPLDKGFPRYISWYKELKAQGIIK